MLSSEAVSLLAEARLHTATNLWFQIIEYLANSETFPDQKSITFTLKQLHDHHNDDAALLISKVFLLCANVKCSQISTAMTVINHLIGDKPPDIDLIWTGPSDGRFIVQHIDKVLEDLIAGSQNRILLISPGVIRNGSLIENLCDASKRGVKLTIILESEGERNNQFIDKARESLNKLLINKSQILIWPNEIRDRNELGRPGKLHVKCAVVDKTGIICSSSIIDDISNRNMDLGVLIRDEKVVQDIVSHFEELQKKAIFRPINIDA